MGPAAALWSWPGGQRVGLDSHCGHRHRGQFIGGIRRGEGRATALLPRDKKFFCTQLFSPANAAARLILPVPSGGPACPDMPPSACCGSVDCRPAGSEFWPASWSGPFLGHLGTPLRPQSRGGPQFSDARFCCAKGGRGVPWRCKRPDPAKTAPRPVQDRVASVDRPRPPSLSAPQGDPWVRPSLQY